MLAIPRQFQPEKVASLLRGGIRRGRWSDPFPGVPRVAGGTRSGAPCGFQWLDLPHLPRSRHGPGGAEGLSPRRDQRKWHANIPQPRPPRPGRPPERSGAAVPSCLIVIRTNATSPVLRCFRNKLCRKPCRKLCRKSWGRRLRQRLRQRLTTTKGMSPCPRV